MPIDATSGAGLGGGAVATAVSSATANSAARVPARASAPDAASEPTLATSIDATSGKTVIRIRLMKIVPIVASTATSASEPGTWRAASANPSSKPATRPISTRVVNDTRASYQYARLKPSRYEGAQPLARRL